MPNFRSVSGGAVPPPPSFKTNFKIATHQALDYSTFLFLGLTSITAEGTNAHPALGKGVNGFWNYTWRGFLDKTDNTYLSAWLLPSILHEDTRYYALGNEHSIPVRILYVISRQAVARTYGGRPDPQHRRPRRQGPHPVHLQVLLPTLRQQLLRPCHQVRLLRHARRRLQWRPRVLP